MDRGAQAIAELRQGRQVAQLAGEARHLNFETCRIELAGELRDRLRGNQVLRRRRRAKDIQLSEQTTPRPPPPKLLLEPPL